MKKTLGYGKQWIQPDDIRAVTDILKSDMITRGRETEKFETALSEYVGAKYCVVVSSGTAALHLAVRALNLPSGGIGITSPITFVASANCLLYNRIQPDFADIDEKTYCLSPDALENRLNQDVKVVIPVHFAGQPAEMDRIQALTTRLTSGAHIIEDASHALGSRMKNGIKIGSCRFSDMAAFSFHAVKTITTGEGGAVTTNSPEYYERLLMLRNHGITGNPAKFQACGPDTSGRWYYEMQELGFNYLLTDFQAALGIRQLSKCDGFGRRRRKIVEVYNRAFQNLEWLTTPFERREVTSAFHLYVIKIDYKRLAKTRQEIMHFLSERGIMTQVHYIPVHLQPFYSRNFGFQAGDYPVAEDYYSRCLSLPLYPGLTDADVERVIQTIREISCS